MKKYAIYTTPEWWLKKYDGRKKEFKGIDKHTFVEAQKKAVKRRYLYKRRPDYEQKSKLRSAYESVKYWSRPECGNYQKVVMTGFTHLYLCSPVYGHQDYNKSRLYPLSKKNACEFLMRVSQRVANS